MDKDFGPRISQLLQAVDHGYAVLGGELLLTPGRVIYIRFLGSCWVMLPEVHAANPPNSLRSFEIFKAVIDKEAFGGVLHPCLLHSLMVGSGRRLTNNIVFLIITKHDTLELVMEIHEP